MLNVAISLLVLKQEDFTHPPHDNTSTLDIGARLNPEHQEAYNTSALVYVGNQCIKNRLGTIEDGRPAFTSHSLN